MLRNQIKSHERYACENQYTCKLNLQCHKMLTGDTITIKSDSELKNTAPACVLVQSNKYPEAAQDYGSSCAPETNDTVLQC